MITFTNRQDQIIDASLKIINQVGVQYYTIKRLAAEIEVTEGAIYKHFESKDAIVEAIIEWTQEDVDRIVDDIRQTEGTSLILLKKLYLARCMHNPGERSLAAWTGVYSAIRNHIELKEQANRVIDTYLDEFKRIIQEGQRVGEIRNDLNVDHMVWVIIGSLHFMLNEWQRHEYRSDLLAQGEAMWSDLEAAIAK